MRFFSRRTEGSPRERLQEAVACGPLVPTPLLSDGLLERCAHGEEFAWSSLYARHHEMARTFLRRMGVPEQALDDACQDVFLEAFRYLPRFRGDCTFKTWLYRLCATQARKVRQRRKLTEALRMLLRCEQSGHVASGELSAGRAEMLVQAALAKLSDPERLVFVLYEMEGVSGRDIAKIAECPEATVWRRLHYARKKFCAFVEEQEGAP